MSNATLAQNAPTTNTEPFVVDKLAEWGLCPDLMEDIMARAEVGVLTYGTKLQPNNGRRADIDAYQESLDGCVYLGQLILEGHPVGNLLQRAIALATEMKALTGAIDAALAPAPQEITQPAMLEGETPIPQEGE